MYSSPDELRSLWSAHFKQLLNEPDVTESTFDECFRKHIDSEVNDMLHTYNRHYDNTSVLKEHITVNEVASTCKRMPNHKSAGLDNVCYESLKYGGHLLFEKLSQMYSAIISYIHVPREMKHSVIIPIYKGKKKPRDDINSYRGISLSLILNKATRSPEISRGQVQKLTPQFLLYQYIILDIDSHCPYLLSGETTFQLTSCSNSLHVYLRFGETTSPI